jgi:hypothetical protein
MQDLIFSIAGIALVVLAIVALSRRRIITGLGLLVSGVACDFAAIHFAVIAGAQHSTIINLSLFLTNTPLALLAWYFYIQKRSKLFGLTNIVVGLMGLYTVHLRPANYSALDNALSAMFEVLVITIGIVWLIAKPKANTTAETKAK